MYYSEIGMARTSSLILPNEILDIMEKDKLELGFAVDKLFHKVNCKQKGGLVCFTQRGANFGLIIFMVFLRSLSLNIDRAIDQR